MFGYLALDTQGYFVTCTFCSPLNETRAQARSQKKGGERTVEARKGGARTYKVLVDWPLMEILCLLAFDSLPPLPQLFMMMDDGHPALLGDPAQ